MLSRKQVLVVFFLAFVPFFAYFLRADLRAYDSYAFLSHTCGKFVIKDIPTVANFVVNILPCDILSIKIVLFGLFFVSLLGIALMGSLFDEKRGWLAVLFSFLSPVLLFEATKFENDAFATPFLIFSAYFYYKARLTKKRRFDLVALGLVGTAGLFWEGSIYWLLGLATTSFVLAVPGIIALILKWREIVGNVLPNQEVVEGQMATGIAMVGGLAFGFALLPAMLYPQVAIFLLFGVLKMKFIWFVAPFLAVGMMKFYVHPKLDKVQWAIALKGTLLVAAVVMVVLWGVALHGHSPHQTEWQAIEYAIEQSEDGFVWNDWSYGYWIIWKGGTPSQFGGGEQQPFGKGIVLTRTEQDCELLKEFDKLFIYNC